MGKKANIYKGLFPSQSEFSHRWATWAQNHMGWAKMKKYNRRVAKKRLRRQQHREEGYNQ